jgi:hypothetical protein
MYAQDAEMAGLSMMSISNFAFKDWAKQARDLPFPRPQVHWTIAP